MSHRSRDAKTNRTLNCRQNWKKPGNNPFLKDINSSFKIAFYRLLFMIYHSKFQYSWLLPEHATQMVVLILTGRDVRGRPTVIQGGQV